jgi:tetratricopeptide (TPR) repeat protein
VRYIRIFLLAGAALSAQPAFAADALKFGPPPAWVHAQAIPAAKPTQAPITLLLSDQQAQIEPGKVITYSETAMKIEKPEGLSEGNITIPWNPANDTVTVNKLQIRRGNQIIDVLAKQKFTTMRRETGLDEAMLDGNLSANIQPEGLQEGDIVDLATTIEHSDPVLLGHVETNFAEWPPMPISLAHVRLQWPASLKLNLRAKGISAQPVAQGGSEVLEFTGHDVQPVIAPKGAPLRFSITRLGEATDFGSWADVARLMMPLYKKAEAIPQSGPLHVEVAKIAAASSDPKMRAAKALQLVQDRVRYVALLMGQGSYVPADAATTWSRRFGDCKGKTALLLGILHALKIEAEPILVQSRLGDMIGERLPILSYFDHVLVRAHIGGKIYYLDGTRTGDTNVDDIEVPNFGWGLPLVADAQLSHIVPPPLSVAQAEMRLDIDASKGIYAAAPANATMVVRDDAAVALQSELTALTDAQREEYLERYWKKLFSFVSYKSGTTSYDSAKRELTLSMAGEAKLDWVSGLFHVPNSTVGFDPDFSRPSGPWQDAPFAVEYPFYAKTVTQIRLPASMISTRTFRPMDIHETVAGVQYDRTATFIGDDFTVATSARSLVPEITANEAQAAEGRLRALAQQDIAMRVPGNYRPTAADNAVLSQGTLDSGAEYFTRAGVYLSSGKIDDALRDLNAGLALDPNNETALGRRARLYMSRHEYEQAEKDVDALEFLEPTNIWIVLARAEIAEGKGDNQACIEGYTKLFQKDPKFVFALGHRAICEGKIGNDAAALADSEIALKTMSSWMDLRVMRANIFMREGKRDLVAKEAEAVTKDNPWSSYAFVVAAKTYAALGEHDRAMRFFARALSLKPEAYVYVNRAQVRPASDTSGRLADLNEALKLDPGNIDALKLRASLLAETSAPAAASAQQAAATKH